MSTGLIMMLKSLGIDPKMLEGVARAVQSAAADLKTIKEQQEIILQRLEELKNSRINVAAMSPTQLSELMEKLPALPESTANMSREGAGTVEFPNGR